VSGAIEIAADHGRRVLVLGRPVALDERVSWVPPGTTGYQRINAYLLLDGGDAMLVDTGVAAHSRVLLDQLAALLPRDARLSIFFTRPLEFSCSGNLEALAATYDVSEIYIGGISSPLDVFEPRRGAPRSVTVRPGDSLPFGAGEPLEVLSPAVRILVTHWLYEPQTRTLFTSDLFTHTTTTDPDAPVVLDGSAEEWPAERVRSHLVAKIWWLTHSPVPAPVQELERLLAAHDIAAIAPTFGRVIQGRESVDRHIDLLLAALNADSTPEERVEARR
jgi:flavorubredoxin